MPSVEDLLQGELAADSFSLWLKVWKSVVTSCLAEHILLYINLDDGCSISTGWKELDDPAQRSMLLAGCADIEQRTVNELLRHSAALNQTVVRGGYTRRTQPAMQRHLSIIIPSFVRQPISSVPIATNPFPTAWRKVANLIAKQAYRETDSAHISRSETRLHDILLLAGFFISCQIPEAALVERTLRQLGKSMISFRGSLVRIVENISDSGIEDSGPPESSRVGGLSLRHAYLSDLLRAIVEESQRAAAGDGIMHRVTRDLVPTLSSVKLRHGVTAQQRRQGRDITYRQHEYTILSYTAIASIEQIVRTWARHKGVHTDRPGRPSDLVGLIPVLECSPVLQEKLRQICAADGANIRNRIMHGGLLDVQNKRLEVLLAVADPLKYPPGKGAGKDHYSPENICQLCFECLELLDAEAASAGKLSIDDLDWTRDLWLSETELDVGRYVHCDFLDSPESTEYWWKYLSTYLTAVVPNVKQFFSIGFIGWMESGADRLLRFMAAVLVLESLYRATVQIHGVSVLQISGDRHVQYRMLDQQQLCSTATLDVLLGSIPASDRDLARHVYTLAIKIRNAFAHGAIARLDDEVLDCVGHLVVKSIQALVGSGVHCMTKVAAYHRWQNLRHGQHGFDLEDWIASEDEILNTITGFTGP